MSPASGPLYRFLLLACERQVQGCATYGPPPGPDDPRDFLREALEEVADCHTYLDWAAQQRPAQRDALRRLRTRIADLGTEIMALGPRDRHPDRETTP